MELVVLGFMMSEFRAKMSCCALWFVVHQLYKNCPIQCTLSTENVV